MTKEELLQIKRHGRIKYIGTDPAILADIAKGPAAAKTKGMVVYRVTDYSTSGWNKEKEIVINTWSGIYFEKCKPEDWILVDNRRLDLTRTREKRAVQRTDRWVRSELSKFSEQFRSMKSTKTRIDSWLNEIPLAERLRILTTLSEEQQAWLQLVSMDPEEVISALKKIATEDPVETIVEAATPPVAE